MWPRFQCDKYITMKIQAVRDILNKKKSVTEVAEDFNVSRQSVSKWISRFRMYWDAGLVPKPPWPKPIRLPDGNMGFDVYNKTSLHLEEKICTLARQMPLFWTRELSWRIESITGERVDQSTIYRILKRNKVRYTRDTEYVRRKSLKRYSLEVPGQEVQLDVCFPFWRTRPEVQYDAIDDCSRFIVSRIHSEHCVRSSMEFVWNLLHTPPYNTTRIQVIRTDCWNEFWKWFTEFLMKLWIEHKKNPPYTPEHNGKVERYHGTLWKHMGEYSLFIDIHEYRYKLKLFTDFYNYHRPHGGYGMMNMTPVEKIEYSLLQNSLAYARESEEPWWLKSFLNVNLILQRNNANLFLSFYTSCMTTSTKRWLFLSNQNLFSCAATLGSYIHFISGLFSATIHLISSTRYPERHLMLTTLFPKVLSSTWATSLFTGSITGLSAALIHFPRSLPARENTPHIDRIFCHNFKINICV